MLVALTSIRAAIRPIVVDYCSPPQRLSKLPVGIAGCAPGYYDHDGYWHADRYRDHGYYDHGSYYRDDHRDSDRHWTCDNGGGNCHWEYRDRD